LRGRGGEGDGGPLGFDERYGHAGGRPRVRQRDPAPGRDHV